MKAKRLHLTNAVRRGPSDTFFTLDYHGRPWPVYLILERDTRLAWIDQREPGSTPIGVVEAVWAWWPLGRVPSRDEAYALVRDLRPLLRAELRRPGDSQDALADACGAFRLAMTFATAAGTLEFDERWFDADGEEAEPWTGVRFVLGDSVSITRATSHDALCRIARGVRAAHADVVIVDLEHYLQRIRDRLEFG